MRISLVVLLVCSFGVAARVSAQDEALDDAHDRQAHAVFEAGREAYAAGEYESALQFFQQAFALSHRTALLYNVAQAADRARQDHVALDAYQQYLAGTPDEELRALVEARIAYFQREIAAHAATATTTTTTEPPPEPRTTPDETTPVAPVTTPSSGGGDTVPGWVAIGGGGAALIAGVIMLGVGAAHGSSVEGAPDGARWADYAGSYSDAQPLMIAGGVIAGLGLAAIALGAVLVATAGSGSSSTTASISIGPGSIRLDGTF